MVDEVHVDERKGVAQPAGDGAVRKNATPPVSDIKMHVDSFRKGNVCDACMRCGKVDERRGTTTAKGRLFNACAQCLRTPEPCELCGAMSNRLFRKRLHTDDSILVNDPACQSETVAARREIRGAGALKFPSPTPTCDFSIGARANVQPSGQHARQVLDSRCRWGAGVRRLPGQDDHILRGEREREDTPFLAIYENKGLLAEAARLLKDSKLDPFKDWIERILRKNSAPELTHAITNALPELP